MSRVLEEKEVIKLCHFGFIPSRYLGNDLEIFLILSIFSDIMIEETAKPISICIDARRFGSKARFARASCRPNIKLQHFFLKGKLHIIGIAAGNIERGEEVVIYDL